MDEEHEGYRRFQMAQKAARWEEQGQHIDAEELKDVPEALDEAAIAQVSRMGVLGVRS